jgi:hypothetical protein
MTKKQHDVLRLLADERTYLVRLQERRVYCLVQSPRRGRSKDITQAVFAAIKPHLNSQTVRPGEILPDGSSWMISRPATIWKAAG